VQERTQTEEGGNPGSDGIFANARKRRLGAGLYLQALPLLDYCNFCGLFAVTHTHEYISFRQNFPALRFFACRQGAALQWLAIDLISNSLYLICYTQQQAFGSRTPMVGYAVRSPDAPPTWRT
jgi:hypothetical protein